MPQYDLDLFRWLSTPARLLFRPFYLLYRFTRGSIQLTIRYISKYLNRKKDMHHSEKHDGSIPDVKPASEPHNLRLPMELVIMITKDLHHTDLMNLTLSSKYLQTAFFGTNNPSQVARDLRQFACAGDAASSANCPVCRIPTCSVRSFLPTTSPPSPKELPSSLTSAPPGMPPHRARPSPQPHAQTLHRLPSSLHPLLLHEPLRPEGSRA